MIDVWNADTFDDPLTTVLLRYATLIQNYFNTDRLITFRREASDHRGIYETNPFAAEFSAFLGIAEAEVSSRTIRAWHYTRLTDTETGIIESSGLHLTSIRSFRIRLARLVLEGSIDRPLAKRICNGSPLRGAQHECRSGRFWATSHPIDYRDSGVEPLLKYWGGEVASFPIHNDDEMLEKLATIGRPRILELGVPVAATDRAYHAAKSIVSTFAKSLGAEGNFRGFDVCIVQPLGPSSVLKIHSDGEAAFINVGSLCDDSK